MENLRITKKYTKINEESEKVFNAIKKNAPACMKRAMKDLDNEE